jgi:hypothetical protein
MKNKAFNFLKKFPALILIVLISACEPLKKTTSTGDQSEQLDDDSLLTLVQFQTFQYFWDGAEPNSGAARERIHLDGIYPQNDQNVVTSGGTGFGLMAILVGIERGFISRKEAVERYQKLFNFLENADRFHGAWPHWMHGETGKVKPFSPKDDGGDLVETSFLAQGLITVREYFKDGNQEEQDLAIQADELWRGIEWDWYTGGGETALYWHWSPNFGWEMNFPITGYNECLITYVMAASSPTHPVDPEVYHQGWARGGEIVNNAEHEQYVYHLALEHNYHQQFGGPLFWAHYSFLGLDPRQLKSPYAHYWEHNVNHTLINRRYCIENPENWKGYGEDAWGLTSSYSPEGYAGHSPKHDLGVITPTAALTSFPYTPDESMEVIRHFYYDLGDRLWGKYGFYDAFSIEKDWFPQRYLAIDQGPIPVMIENHRSGLLWRLFMQAPEVQKGLQRLGFQF